MIKGFIMTIIVIIIIVMFFLNFPEIAFLNLNLNKESLFLEMKIERRK